MLSLNVEKLDEYMADAGYTTRSDLARAMGVHGSTVTRMLADPPKVGAAAYAGLRRAFPGRSIDALILAE